MTVRVQREDVDPGGEIARLSDAGDDPGAVASFIGLVRRGSGADRIAAMTLEHYPGMTERMLARLEAEARRRWPLIDCVIIHRFGRLEPGERIVLVVVSARHRAAAFDACAFLMDWLKTKAPFWKLEDGADGARWVEARDSDDAAADRWNEDDTAPR